MKEEKNEKKLEVNESDEMNIEDITEIQGGVEEEDGSGAKSCGLGCILGAGSGVV